MDAGIGQRPGVDSVIDRMGRNKDYGIEDRGGRGRRRERGSRGLSYYAEQGYIKRPYDASLQMATGSGAKVFDRNSVERCPWNYIPDRHENLQEFHWRPNRNLEPRLVTKSM